MRKHIASRYFVSLIAVVIHRCLTNFHILPILKSDKVHKMAVEDLPLNLAFNFLPPISRFVLKEGQIG